jgi:acetylornithine deacetylase
MEQILADLISIPSQSGSEQQILLFITKWLQQQGIQASFQSSNTVGFIKGKNSEKCLILSGHVDTVGTGNLEQWDTNPFMPKKTGGKMYGLGASDMKAGVAVIMELAKYYTTHTPACDLYFAFVAGEEVDGHGSQQFIKWFQDKTAQKKYKTVEALITEPTHLEKVEIGHRGNQFVKIAIKSHSGHAAFPQPDDSAIPLANQVITGLLNLHKTWAKKYKDAMLGSPSIAVTGIKAGDFNTPNKIADESIIQLDIRTVRGMHSQVPDLLNKFLASVTDKAKLVSCEGAPPGVTEKQSALRQAFSTLKPSLPQEAMIGSSDLCFFVNAGIPAIIFGPGEKEVIHDENEYVLVKNLDRCLTTLKKIVGAYGA